MKTKFTILVFLALAFNGIAQTTLTLQPDSASGKDAALDSYWNAPGSPTPWLGAEAWTHGGYPENGRSLLAFDLSSIPAGSTIQSAHLFLYYASDNVWFPQQSHLTFSDASYLQRIIAPWNQYTTTWTTQPGTTTMNEVTLPEDTSPSEDYVSDVKALVQDMIDNPSTSFGFMLRLQTEQTYAGLVFASSQHPDSALHPKLEITYTSCTSLILQPDSASGKDAALDSYWNAPGSPTPWLGAEAWTHGGYPENGRSLLSFDLSSIPVGSTIQSANLFLYYASDNVWFPQQSHLTFSDASYLQRIITPWDQYTTTWTTQPGTTTVNEVTLPEDTSPSEDYVSDVKALVQDMIDNPTTSFGFMLRLQTEQTYAGLVFTSSQHPDSALHPKLDICYVTPSGIPPLINTQSDLNFYPNPATNQLTIHTSSMHRNEAITVSVLNVLGEIIQEEKVKWSNDISINVSALAAGIYIVQITSESKRWTGKFIKE